MMRHLVWGVFGLVTQQVFSQASQPDNLGGLGSFLGWNAAAAQILDVNNKGNLPIDFYTHNLPRMRLYETTTGALPLLGGGTVNVRQNGYLAICPEPNFFDPSSYGPFSRLHLADTAIAGEGLYHYAQPWGYRPPAAADLRSVASEHRIGGS